MSVDRRQWTLEMIEASRATAEKIGISPEAVVAQMAVESGWGRNAIGHALFGIKAGPSWKGKRQTVRTREVDEAGHEYYIDAEFRDYDSFADSIADHFAFLDSNSRYRSAGVFDGKGDDAYFEALQRAGYATDPNYATVLKSVLRSVQQIAGSAPTAPVHKMLHAGDSGPDVAALKRALNAQNDAMLDEDDQFDTVTAAAVIHFQRARGLTIDGIAGPQTLGALGLA